LQQRELEDLERREKNLEEAKKITIQEDTSLPTARLVSKFLRHPNHQFSLNALKSSFQSES